MLSVLALFNFITCSHKYAGRKGCINNVIPFPFQNQFCKEIFWLQPLSVSNLRVITGSAEILKEKAHFDLLQLHDLELICCKTFKMMLIKKVHLYVYLKPSWGVISFLWTSTVLYWIFLLALVTPAHSLPLWSLNVEGWINHNQFLVFCHHGFSLVLFILFYSSSYSSTSPIGNHSTVWCVFTFVLKVLVNYYFVYIFNSHKWYCAIE